jgi:chaperonin cofactor prefoldin
MAIFDNFSKKVGKVANDAAAKSRELAEIARHSVAISEERATVRMLYRDIGELFYREHRQEAAEDLKSFCDKIDVAAAKIHDLESKVRQIKGVRICTSCGETSDRRARFCPACGQAFPVEEPVSPVEKPDHPADDTKTGGTT